MLLMISLSQKRREITNNLYMETAEGGSESRIERAFLDASAAYVQHKKY